MVAMAGKNCVAVACDKRYGMQYQTVATDKNKVFKMHDRSPLPSISRPALVPADGQRHLSLGQILLPSPDATQEEKTAGVNPQRCLRACMRAYFWAGGAHRKKISTDPRLLLL